jgi:hypothetical protein
MRTTAWLFLVTSLVIVADLSYTQARRVLDARRMPTGDQLAVAVEDWEYGAYFASALGLCAAAWLAGLTISPDRRVARLTYPAVRGSVIGAAILGGLFGIGFGVWFWAAGEGLDTRSEWEARWLIGSVVGAGCGAAIGVGLGTVAYLRPPKTRPEVGPPDPRTPRSAAR